VAESVGSWVCIGVVVQFSVVVWVGSWVWCLGLFCSFTLCLLLGLLLSYMYIHTRMYGLFCRYGILVRVTPASTYKGFFQNGIYIY
jgi:hypothetical protein